MEKNYLKVNPPSKSDIPDQPPTDENILVEIKMMTNFLQEHHHE